MKKVLITASGFGHIRSFHLPYIDSFRALGWQIHVACAGEPTEDIRAHRCIPVPFEKSMSSISNFKAARLLRRLVKRERYDLLITHTSLAAFFTRLALLALPHRPRVINVMHGYLFDDDTAALKAFLLKSAERIAAPVTDVTLTMNRYDDEWANRHRVSKEVRFIPGMGVDTAKAAIPAGGIGYRRSTDDFLMVYPAEFSERKNQSMLIRAMKLLPESAVLILPGRGELLERCKALAKQEGVEDRVIFPGFVENVWPLLRSCSAAVSSSRSEGLPFNLMEAMLSALPVVCSRVKGNADLVDEGVTGYLFPYDDEKAFAEAILKLMADPTASKEMGRRGCEKAQPYKLENVLPIVMEEYLRNV